jgi:hypothetical protein
MTLAAVALRWASGRGLVADLQPPDFSMFLEITAGLDDTAPVRGEDQVIPFRRGLALSSHFADARPIILTGFVQDTDADAPETYRTAFDLLKALFSPTSGLGRLTATLEDGTTRHILARPVNIIAGNQDSRGFREVSIELSALDPYWYGRWGAMTADSGYLANFHDTWPIPQADGSYVATPSGLYRELRADSSTEIICAAGTVNLSLDVPGNRDCERARVIWESIVEGQFPNPGTWLMTAGVGETGIGFSVSRLSGTVTAPGLYPRVIVDNDARLVMWGLEETDQVDPSTSLRQYLIPNVGNQNGEFLRLPAGPCNLQIVTPVNLRARVQFFPTYE